MIKPASGDKFSLRTVPERVDRLRSSLIDLHDPAGIYFHRAANACLATFIAASIPYIPPDTRPLLVLSALCFTLTTGPLNRTGRSVTLLGSLLVTLAGTVFLILTRSQPLLQGSVLILLGFLVHYLTGIHRLFAGGIFVWILCLLAAAGAPDPGRLPETLSALVLGCSIVFLCYFVFLPRDPERIFLSLRDRLGLRLATRLEKTLAGLSSPRVRQKDEPDRAIVSLLTAQYGLLDSIEEKKGISREGKKRYRRAIVEHEKIFEAILILETALQAIPSRSFTPIAREELINLGRRATDSLRRQDLKSIESDGFGRWLEERENDAALTVTERLKWRHIGRAMINLTREIDSVGNSDGGPTGPMPEIIAVTGRSTPRKFFDIHHPVHRRALRTAIAIFLGTIVVTAIRPSHGEWIILSAFIVSQDTVGSSLWKAEGRFTGAALGAIASLAVYALIRPYHELIFITAFLTIFPYVYLLPALDNYGFAYFFLQVAYVCFLAAIGKPLSAAAIGWRAISISIGCALGIGVALSIFPTSARSRLQEEQLRAWREMHRWYGAIFLAYRSPTVGNQPDLEPFSGAAIRSVFGLETYLASRQHELFGRLKKGFDPATLRRADTEFIRAYRSIYRSLLYLEAIVRDLPPSGELAGVTVDRLDLIDSIFTRIDGAIRTHSPYSLPSLPNTAAVPENRPDELDIFLQLESLYRTIDRYSERRNRFLSLLNGNDSGF